jgi:hypothetical protein
VIVIAALATISLAATAFASCGDGIVDVGESCDDTNTDAGDGCSDACQVEVCWACAGEPSVCAPDDGASCDDGVFCDGADTCDAGACSVHAGNPCPGADGDGDCSESCNEAAGNCTANDPNGSACDDGLFCTGADTCNAGSCTVHAGDPCPGPDGDGDCSESCNEAANNCTANDADGSACDDGTFCNGADTCNAGSCNVHDGDPCPGPDGDGNCSESCNEAANNCTAHDPNGSACTDGLFCDGADTCSSGACTVHAGNPCPGPDGDGNCSESCNEAADNCTAPDPNGSSCNDGLFCDGADTCSAGSCSVHAGDPCPGADGDADCSESCNEAADNCTANDPNGSSCNDGVFCDGADTCNAGSCNVHAGDPCPGPDGDGNCSESCNEAADNCTAHDPNGSSCDDGAFCTGVDFCSNGACSAHTGDPCPGPDGDGNCSESCNEAADNCTAPDPNGSSCDDGLFCTGADTCSAGACSVHAGSPCPGPDGDGNCSESCSEAADNCTAPDPNGSACNDGLFCNGADTCNAGACTVHPGNPCPGPDGDGNCSESCNESTDSCTAPDPNGAACDDGLFCTGLDFCANGTCSAHTNDPCPGPDGDANCSESCDEAADSCTGPDPDGSACNDGLYCTGADFCAAGTCSAHPSPPCPGPDGDGDCKESCNEATHACNANDPNGSACDDGLFCTVNDACTAGNCGGAARDCNAVGDQCNDGVCDENDDVCVGPPKAEGTPCNDGDACTVPDTCDGSGTCTGLPDTMSCLDPFTCYKAGPASGGPRFTAVTNVTLQDQFRTSTVTVLKPRRLCLPSDPDDAAPDAPAHSSHLEDYQVKPAFSFIGTGNRTISNQFGTLVLTILKPVGLFEPTLKSLTAPPGPLALPAVDHFQCYSVKVASGQPKFTRFQIPVNDQFGLRVVTVLKPRRLCAPVNEDGGQPGAEMHPTHLLCYQIKEYSDPKFSRVTPIYVHTQFGPETLGAYKPTELCIPSTKSP